MTGSAPDPGINTRPAFPEQELLKRFTYHKPNAEQVERYGLLRQNAFDLATLIWTLCPDSREKSLAITKLEEAVMWANAAIARRSEQ